MNKSAITNIFAVLIIIAGYLLKNNLILNVGLFALSGAITNWLAIHMLFEKVPGLYGSGVIPAHFEDFKASIKNLMMQQFFTQDNIERFITGQGKGNDFHIGPVIEKVDFSQSYDSLVKVIMESSFGSMLGMFGGEEALIPLKEPFIQNLKQSLINISNEESFQLLLREQLEQPDVMSDIKQQIEDIVDRRLNELTPAIVKQIIQDMIRQHLGWLVVWGGVFGGIIGFLSGIIQF